MPDLHISRSLIRAIEDPQYFQMVPMIVGIDPSIPANEFSKKIENKFNIKIGSQIPSMNMFGMIAPRGLWDNLVTMEPITELHFDHPQYALETPPQAPAQPAVPTFPPLPNPFAIINNMIPPGLPKLPGMQPPPAPEQEQPADLAEQEFSEELMWKQLVPIETEGLIPPPPNPKVVKLPPLTYFYGISDVFADNIPKWQPNTGWIPTAEALKIIRVPDLWKLKLQGNGVKVAVLDTGIDNKTPQIQGTVGSKSTMKAFPMGEDENGHGTWCATCIRGKPMRHPITGLPVAGAAPQCTLTSWKVLGYGIGTGATSDIMAAIDQAVEAKNRIISMSLGSMGRGEEEQDPMVAQINAYYKERPEVLFVIAAGNSGPRAATIGVPGCAEGAITVGSWGIKDEYAAYFSSRGPTVQAGRMKPDIMAPGGGRAVADARPKETLFSGTSIGSLLDGIDDKLMDGFTSMAGTSMATPAVAGALSQWLQAAPSITAPEVKQIFREMGRPKDNTLGHGLFDATWLLNYYDV